MTRHVMLDIETLSTTANAVVLSIGAASDNNDQFYARLNIADQLERGRNISADTLNWWYKQNDEARGQVFGDHEDRIGTREGLELFAKFLKTMGDRVRVWGNGADFDNAIVANLYQMYELPLPWQYRDNRCFRTLKNISAPNQEISPPVKHTGFIPHHALHDAMYQMSHLKEIGKWLSIN